MVAGNETENKEVCKQKSLPFAFHPKATNYIYRQVFWLVLFWLPSHPDLSGQWLECAKTY